MKTLQKSLNFFLFLKTEASKIRLCFVFDFARWMALFWVECFHAWPEECIFLIIRMIHRWNFQRFAFWEFRRVTRECKIRHLETMIPLYQYFFYYRTRCYCRIITLEAHARFTSEWALRAECGFYFSDFRPPLTSPKYRYEQDGTAPPKNVVLDCRYSLWSRTNPVEKTCAENSQRTHRGS